MDLSLSIVIVNWNSRSLLRECVASLGDAVTPLAAGNRVEQVIVVDNASVDGSAEGLATDAARVEVIRNDRNRGFGAACNQGAARATSDLILFLNPDTRLAPSSLAAPFAHFADPANAQTGIVGVQLVDEEGKVSRTCAHFPRPSHFLAHAVGVDRLFPSTAHAMEDWDHRSTREVDQVIGAFFVVRRSLFEALGGFDERFFVYFEEIDLSLRARQAGWRTMFLAEGQAYHAGGGTTAQVKGRRLAYSLRSRWRYARKHFGGLDQLAIALVAWGIEPVGRTLHLALRGRFGEVRDVAEAYAHLVRGGP